MTAFDPGFIIIASGQDANQYDPNGRQCVTMAGFRGLGRARPRPGRPAPDGQLLLVQEGGYARTYSAACLLATVEGVLGLDETLARPARVPARPAEARRGRHRRYPRRPGAPLGGPPMSAPLAAAVAEAEARYVAANPASHGSTSSASARCRAETRAP